MTIRQNVLLKSYNSFSIDAKANYFARFHSIPELEEALVFHQKKFTPASTPMILGGGSNILLTQDIDGLVLKNDIDGISVVKEDDKHIYVRAGAGESWHGFVEYCIANDYAGVENLSLIPGNVGASPMQNIGAYGVELKDVFYSLEAFHLHEKTLVEFSAADCQFGYRESVFKGKYRNQFAILSVCFRLDKIPTYHVSYGVIEQELDHMQVKEWSIKAISQAVINIRRSKLPDPAVIGNAGSFFKNPEISNEQYEMLLKKFPKVIGYPLANGNTKLAAGWLIEYCGWKGFRRGDAGCHEKQALVLVNYGIASGQDVLALSEEIMKSVFDTFGIELQREVNII